MSERIENKSVPHLDVLPSSSSSTSVLWNIFSFFPHPASFLSTTLTLIVCVFSSFLLSFPFFLPLFPMISSFVPFSPPLSPPPRTIRKTATDRATVCADHCSGHNSCLPTVFLVDRACSVPWYQQGHSSLCLYPVLFNMLIRQVVT